MKPRWLVAGLAVVAFAGVATGAVFLVGNGAEEPPRTADPAPTTAPTLGVPQRRDPPPTTTTTTIPPARAIDDIPVRAVQIAELSGPLALTARPGDEALYVAEQGGRLQRVEPDGTVTTVLDITDDVSTGSEQGLLGAAFTPDGVLLYTNYTDTGGDTRVHEFTMRDRAPDLESRREVLTVSQPFGNHNGGHLAFGPDGHLYISLGDGGSGGDPQDHGQNRGTLLGSILRIHPRPTQGAAYAVPADNPFVGVEGARPEIWAYGLRNPWRFSFDRETADLWIADVGQDAVEEINFEPAGSEAGRNYGWARLEGSRPFRGAPPADHVLPVHEYPLVGGNCSVIGGYVYRGAAVPALRGVYVFSDFCAGDLRGLRLEDGSVTEVGGLGISIPRIASFGQDADGELYAMSLAGGVYRFEPDDPGGGEPANDG